MLHALGDIFPWRNLLGTVIIFIQSCIMIYFFTLIIIIFVHLMPCTKCAKMCTVQKMSRRLQYEKCVCMGGGRSFWDMY